MKQFLLFTGKNCHACHKMVDNMIKAGMSRIEIDTNTFSGAELARDFHVQSIPTLVVVDMQKIDKSRNLTGIPIASYVGTLPVDLIQKIMKEFLIQEALS